MMRHTISFNKIYSNNLTFPFLVALIQLILQMICHGNYGYFRDELYYIACSDHLAFGYVDQPPLSIAILAVSRFLLGDSLHALRFLPALAGSGTIILAALIARQFGGERFAQGFAALSVAAAHTLLGITSVFSMNAFDVFFWALALFMIISILKNNTPKLWLLFGVVVGLGLLNKYSIGFLCVGLFAGLLFTPHRKQLMTKWFWLGALVAFILFLPHILWEIKYGFPSLEFIRNASRYKNVGVSVFGLFLSLLRDMNFLNAPIWSLGLYFLFFHQDGKRFRPLGWMFVVIFVIMVTGSAKVYYLSPIFPMLLAAGAVFVERIIRDHGWNRIKPIYALSLIVVTIAGAPFSIPVLRVETFIQYQNFLGLAPHAEEHSALGVLPQYYADRFGWKEMTATVAGIYAKLTPEEQAKCFIYVRNYGEAGAIDFFGKKFGLPNAHCGHNNYWLWGPGDRTGDVAIIFGNSRNLEENVSDLNRYYKQVEFVATTNCKYAMPYENGRQIFLCRGMNTTFQDLWPNEHFFI